MLLIANLFIKTTEIRKKSETFHILLDEKKKSGQNHNFLFLKRTKS